MGVEARVVVLPQEAGAALWVERVELPEPGPHQVVLKQFASGVCHSQLHQMHAARTAPVVLGHESTGVVLEVGSEVTAVAPGDHVMVTWIPARPLGGRKPAPAAVALGDGTVAISQNVFTWADHTIADEAYLVPMPAEAATDVTSIIGCAVMTGAGAITRTAGVQAGASVAVFGAGGVGLCAIAAAKAVGASTVIAVDLDVAKLELAARFGATHLVDASAGDAVEMIRDITRAPGLDKGPANRPTGGVDYAFDCIGVDQTMKQILQAVRFGVIGERAGGMAVLIGVPTAPCELDVRTLMSGEKTYRGSLAGSCRPDADFPTFLDWHADGLLDLDLLVTRRYTIDEINDATTALARGQILGRAILEF